MSNAAVSVLWAFDVPCAAVASFDAAWSIGELNAMQIATGNRSFFMEVSAVAASGVEAVLIQHYPPIGATP
ncbi:hypothetical protein PTKU64_83230 [Paraburkholderia terrae]|uniref:Uncharacterized protein n=1 Tax=Paraburkholderia terrae TaxID=311230 RepID=A0ABN6JXA5_9BURK|nr:hypothetical protein PTKU64_83230 [Paraburkholderia terrae]